MQFDIWNHSERKIRCIDNTLTGWFKCNENSHLLTVGDIYTVTDVEVHSWHTNVYVAEIPGVAFNSVLFEEIES